MGTKEEIKNQDLTLSPQRIGLPEPDFGVTSINYDFAELLARAGAPGEDCKFPLV